MGEVVESYFEFFVHYLFQSVVDGACRAIQFFAEFIEEDLAGHFGF